jgi:type IV secretion system protein VirD4
MEQQVAILQLNDLLNEIFYNRDETKDKYWNESAGQFAFGICMLLLELKENLNMKNLLRWRYEKLNDGTLKDIYDKLPPESEIYQNLAGYMDLTAENTKSCIRSTFDQLVRVFKSAPALTEMLSSTTFDMKDIGKDKVAVFIVIPDEKTTFHFLATLFISQCYTFAKQGKFHFGGILQSPSYK